MRTTWDIFCNVVDNYGDIGVTWRLARQLVVEHNMDVRLWVSDLDALCHLCPEATHEMDVQTLQGVSLHYWSSQWQPETEAADVVIEAFACQLPLDYIDSMAARLRPSLWLNLEYLSAEKWVNGCHGLPSLQEKGLQKFFFFPGFTSHTGGLLREKNLIARRNQFQQTPSIQNSFLKRLGIDRKENALLVSLFAYENEAIFSWLDALSIDPSPTHLLIPEGKILNNVRQWLSIKELSAGDIHECGYLTLQILPFLCQEDYDRLLWSCDLNAVRGEDSFVRALWAGRPLLWHVYPQNENGHLEKMNAFLEFYTKTLAPPVKSALLTQWHAWNSEASMFNSWESIRQVCPELTKHAEMWSTQQSEQTNLAEALALFYQYWV